MNWITFVANKSFNIYIVENAKDEKSVIMKVPERYGVEVCESRSESSKHNVPPLLSCIVYYQRSLVMRKTEFMVPKQVTKTPAIQA